MTGFGDFKPLCSNTPSYTWCNLFYRQLRDLGNADSLLQGFSKDHSSAPVGVNPVCGIPRVGHEGSFGNIANLVACILSMLVMGVVIFVTERRKAAVGRVEIRNFFVCYFLTLPFQILTTGSFLEQGSTALVVLTAVHAGLVAALFWMLLANALVATQILEDGTMSSLMPFFIFTTAFFIVTMYISLDVGLGFTKVLGPSDDPSSLRNIPLFIFTSIWPAAAALIFFGLMSYIVVGVLKETKPMAYYALAAFLFVLSQLAWFMLGKVICEGTSRRVDGSFIATILETACVVVLFLSWRSITVEDWDEESSYNNYKY
ncbi:hypothetical protein VKT23_012003 [Stygiomarasmius scandens]|uniref:Chitin synthase export chaperone n=1 Tax=Marasmiellus scandens TaxID=2682957 RepID=A0ABR1J8B9_9AGAR